MKTDTDKMEKSKGLIKVEYLCRAGIHIMENCDKGSTDIDVTSPKGSWCVFCKHRSKNRLPTNERHWFVDSPNTLLVVDSPETLTDIKLNNEKQCQKAAEEARVKVVEEIREKFDEYWYSIPTPRNGKINGLEISTKIELILKEIESLTDTNTKEK